jgi:hypothetical protein
MSSHIKGNGGKSYITLESVKNGKKEPSN